MAYSEFGWMGGVGVGWGRWGKGTGRGSIDIVQNVLSWPISNPNSKLNSWSNSASHFAFR